MKVKTIVVIVMDPGVEKYQKLMELVTLTYVAVLITGFKLGVILKKLNTKVNGAKKTILDVDNVVDTGVKENS